MARVHRERAHGRGQCSNPSSKDQTRHCCAHLGYSRTPLARSQHGNAASRAHRSDAERGGLKITQEACGQAQRRRDPAPAKAPRAEPRKRAEAQQRRADVQRATEEDVRQNVVREPQDDHDCHARRDSSDATATVSRQQYADDDDGRGDHRRDEEQEHLADAGDQLDEHVHEGVHRPEGVERQRPTAQRHIARTHCVSLQHNGGSVRVSRVRVACRQVQDSGQEEEATDCDHRNGRARSMMLGDRAVL